MLLTIAADQTRRYAGTPRGARVLTGSSSVGVAEGAVTQQR